MLTIRYPAACEYSFYLDLPKLDLNIYRRVHRPGVFETVSSRFAERSIYRTDGTGTLGHLCERV